VTVSSRPDLADALADSLSRLGLALDQRQQSRLLQFGELLRQWNRVHNLTAIDRPDQLLTHHLLDSLAAVPTIARRAGGRHIRLLDVGSGGGMPGIPAAIAMPDVTVTLIDKVRKKAAFLLQAKLELQLHNVEVLHGRVEGIRTEPFDIITARALSSLDELVRWTRHLLVPGGCWIAMKGSLPLDEIAALARAAPEVAVVDTVKLRVPGLEAERHLVVIEPL
jgi:16S rRNA (guanine527-N7)-methyltransferase